MEVVLVYLLQLSLQGFYLCFLLFVGNSHYKRLLALLFGKILILRLTVGTFFLGTRLDILDFHIDGLALTLQFLEMVIKKMLALIDPFSKLLRNIFNVLLKANLLIRDVIIEKGDVLIEIFYLFLQKLIIFEEVLVFLFPEFALYLFSLIHVLFVLVGLSLSNAFYFVLADTNILIFYCCPILSYFLVTLSWKEGC